MILCQGTGTGPTEEEVCYWLTRLKRHEWGTSGVRAAEYLGAPQGPEMTVRKRIPFRTSDLGPEP